jgi:hypothetical protein
VNLLIAMHIKCCKCSSLPDGTLIDVALNLFAGAPSCWLQAIMGSVVRTLGWAVQVGKATRVRNLLKGVQDSARLKRVLLEKDEAGMNALHHAVAFGF